MTLPFRGLKDYRTEPAALRSDLQRQNALIESAFSNVTEAFRASPAPVFVSRSAAARLGSLVLADAMLAALTVTLPAVGPDDAGASVIVVKTDGTGNAVNVQGATERQLIQGSSSPDAIAARGLREYIFDGQGGWWRR